jgi:hypothetical protein
MGKTGREKGKVLARKREGSFSLQGKEIVILPPNLSIIPQNRLGYSPVAWLFCC